MSTKKRDLLNLIEEAEATKKSLLKDIDSLRKRYASIADISRSLGVDIHARLNRNMRNIGVSHQSLKRLLSIDIVFPDEEEIKPKLMVKTNEDIEEDDDVLGLSFLDEVD